MKTGKNGISLIVLVITIIVMIILATAIILSLNSSNISGKANEAKLTSDLASKKEAASVYVSEYELKVAKGKIDKTTITADAYVKAEMEKAGIDITDVAVQEDGTILVGIAALFVNQEIPIGTTVKGYKLNNTTTYKTSGKENTYDISNDVDSNPQPYDINREDIDEISWQYFGVDENGNVLIIKNVTEFSTAMRLGGKGGYLYGQSELNKACSAMYSGVMGKARSINIDDVIRVLEYTGEKGAYRLSSTDNNKYISTGDKAKTINEIAKEKGYSMDNFKDETPEEGREIGTYKSNHYYIQKENEEDKKQYNYSNQEAVKLIYTERTYWIASTSVCAYFEGKYADFRMRHANADVVTSNVMCDSNRGASSSAFKIRPVVSLNPSIQMTYDTVEKTVTLK